MTEYEEIGTLDEALDDILTGWGWDSCIDAINDYLTVDDLKNLLKNELTFEQKKEIYLDVYYPIKENKNL